MTELIAYKKQAFAELDELAKLLGFDDEKHSDIEVIIDIHAKESMNMSIADFVDMCVMIEAA